MLTYITHLNVCTIKPEQTLFYCPFGYIIYVNERTVIMDIGKRLFEIRSDKGMTRYRLTQITGVSGHHIKVIEEGTRQPTIDTLQRLVEALGLTLSEFFNESKEATFLSQNERTLLENFRALSDEKAQALLSMSEVLKK